MINSETIIDIVLKENAKILRTHYKVLLESQTKIAKATYRSTIGMERVVQIMKLANHASKDEKAILRNELHNLLQNKYKILKEEGILQYQFLLGNNESFYRAHKPSKFGDDLTSIREDFKYTNENKEPISVFVQGRVAHGFRNVFPLFDKNNNHIGAMEVSFSSDSFQWYLNHISKIHSHFIVNKKIFDAKVWQRDDLVLKYEQSAENMSYMIALGKKHLKEECVIENTQKLQAIREEISTHIILEKSFSLYFKYGKFDKHIEVISFLPIFSMDEKPLAWIISYEESSLIKSTLMNVWIVRGVLFFLSIILVFYIYKQLSTKEKIEVLTKRQETLLSLFDRGESVLFKWNNDENWSINYVSKSVQKLLNFNSINFMNGDITYLECIHKDDLARVIQEVEDGSNSNKDYFIHEPYRVITKDKNIKWVIDNTIVERDSDGKITHYIGYINDITALKNKEELLDEILNSSNNLIFLTNFKKVLLSNNKFKELIDKSFNDDVIDLFMNVDGYLHQGLLKENEDFIGLLSRTKAENRVVSIIDKHLEVKAFAVSVSKVDNNSKCLVTLTDITKMKEQQIATAKKVYVDALTKVYNRNKFDEVLKDEFIYVKRYKHPLSIAILDVDKFKDFNDTYGHLTGDEVLITLAQTVNNSVREADTFARWGGEEFVILFKETRRDIAKEVSQKLKEKIQANKHEVAGTITASFGVTEYQEGDTVESIFMRCDEALYLAKENGRNRVEVL